MLRDGRATLDFATTGSDERAQGTRGGRRGAAHRRRSPARRVDRRRHAGDADEPIARVLARHLAHARAREARIRAAVMPVLAGMESAGLAARRDQGIPHRARSLPRAGHATVRRRRRRRRSEPRSRATQIACCATPGSSPRSASARRRTRANGAARRRRRRRLVVRALARTEPWRLDLHDGSELPEVIKYVRTPQAPRFADVLHAGRRPAPRLRRQRADRGARHARSTELYSHRLLRLVELVLVVRRATTLGTPRLGRGGRRRSPSRGLKFAYPTARAHREARTWHGGRRAAGEVLDGDHGASARRHERAVADGTDPRRELLAARAAASGRPVWAPRCGGCGA